MCVCTHAHKKRSSAVYCRRSREAFSTGGKRLESCTVLRVFKKLDVQTPIPFPEDFSRGRRMKLATLMRVLGELESILDATDVHQ